MYKRRLWNLKAIHSEDFDRFKNESDLPRSNGPNNSMFLKNLLLPVNLFCLQHGSVLHKVSVEEYVL